MKKSITVLSLLVALILFAEVPQLINYQGKIIDDDGLPINDEMNVTFKIYDSEMNGNILWNETQNVIITDGVFNVLLGSVEDFSDSLFNENERYLAIQIEGESEIAERSRLVSTPYSINAQQLNGKDDEEILFPYQIKFMSSTFYKSGSQEYAIVYILTANGDFYRWTPSGWEQFASPPIQAENIIFMDATAVSWYSYFEWSNVIILTKDGSFYKYEYPSNHWEQQTNSPVSP